MLDGRFGDAVGGHAGHRGGCGAGRDVDDPPPPAAYHVAQCLARAEERARKIDVDGALPLGQREVENWPGSSGVTRIIYQDVHAAPAPADGLESALNVR